MTTVSIRAPIQGPGRLNCFRKDVHRSSVSIRAPIQGPGRLLNERMGLATLLFQSAPRSKDRGDSGQTVLTVDALKVSIRAPIQGPGRRIAIAQASNLVNCFNPRPDPRTGATRIGNLPDLPSAVSIRAPIQGPGRPFTAAHLPAWHEFQSAPRSKDRGDLCKDKLSD